MAEPQDDHELTERTSAALHHLRQAIRERVPVPPSTQMRRRAERHDATRYASAVAAAVVVLVVLVAVWQLPRRPTPLGITASPSPSQNAVAPSAPASTPIPQPPPVTDTSITQVNFDDRTVDLAPNPGVPSCPTGPVHILGALGKGSDGRQINPVNSPLRVFGDVDRDGRLDAIETAGCYPLGGDETEQLLIVSRRSDGTLTGRWAGPVLRMDGGLASIGQYVNFWVTADDVLFADIRPIRLGPDYVLGQVHAYLWGGDRLVEIPQGRYPALLPTQYNAAPPVALGLLPAALGCPAGTVRFNADGKATVGQARYDTVMPPDPLFAAIGPDPTQLLSLRQWVEIAGRRVLLARINCTGPDGMSGGAVAVLAPQGPGLTVIDSVRVPGNAGAAWDYDFGDGTLIVITRSANPRSDIRMEWTWDGARFERSR